MPISTNCFVADPRIPGKHECIVPDCWCYCHKFDKVVVRLEMISKIWNMEV